MYVGTFIDDQDDWRHVDVLKSYCEECYVASLKPLAGKIRGLTALLNGGPLTIPYYYNAELKTWVERIIEEQKIDKALVFSSAMAQYLDGPCSSMMRIIDFVDVDSDKWSQYAEKAGWPMKWIYQREAKTLLQYDIEVTKQFDLAAFVSQEEAELFKQLAPEYASKVTFFNNGVDVDYFSNNQEFDNPYPSNSYPIVFTGAMDYWANADAVVWFANKVLPEVRKDIPQAQFYIVGARPIKSVTALKNKAGVNVTGSVHDIRPYLAHAKVVVAPMRIARGIQNKVLEAMAMAKPVVASQAAYEGINAVIDKEILVAEDENDFITQVKGVLTDCYSESIGENARSHIVVEYSWANNIAKLIKLYEHR